MFTLLNKRFAVLALVIASVGGTTLQTSVNAHSLDKSIQEVSLTKSSIENNKTIPLTLIDALPNQNYLVAQAAQPYVGEWSNGRGETMSMTSNTIKFGRDKKLAYKNITKVTDGNYFEIQITSPGKINYFSKYLALQVDGKQMKMTGYNSYKDMKAAQNQGLQVTWYRD
ncbi:hypothetical protein [Iningainema tapete]|uniref:Uncharacterized protein n=1 Tax=Iningainema tapete BLCC-T55 TaxID=2748662 RepID=A0A8J6XGR9_9CYAN|nr:hypothetical protein [Iningainema tapete]MBD2771761.1 hypothetical protein [Iningainema tapete BLCC-T55]